MKAFLIVGFACLLASCGSGEEVSVVHPKKFDLKFVSATEGKSLSDISSMKSSLSLGAFLKITEESIESEGLSDQKVFYHMNCDGAVNEIEGKANEKIALLDILPAKSLLYTSENPILNCHLMARFPLENTSDFRLSKNLKIDLNTSVSYLENQTAKLDKIAVSFNGVYELIAEDIEQIDKIRKNRFLCERASQDFNIHDVSSKSSVREEIKSWMKNNKDLIVGGRCRLVGISNRDQIVLLGPLFKVYGDLDLGISISAVGFKFYETTMFYFNFVYTNNSNFDILMNLDLSKFSLIFEGISNQRINERSPVELSLDNRISHSFLKNTEILTIPLRSGESIQLHFRFDPLKINILQHHQKWVEHAKAPAQVQVSVADPRIEKRFHQTYRFEEAKRSGRFTVFER